MQRDTKTCQVSGHEMYKITHICTYKQCQQSSRFMCEECNRNQIHIHDAHQQFMRLEDFHIYLNTKVKAKIESQKKEAKRISQSIQQINSIIEKLKNIVEQQEINLFNLHEIGKTYKRTDKQLLTLSNKEMNYFINIEDGNLDYIQTQNDLSKIIKIILQLQKDCFAFTYSIHNVLKIEGVDSPSISQNEQYLGFINKVRGLKVNKLKSNQTLMNKIFCSGILQAKFSSNSKFIYSLDYLDKKNCKLIFSRNIDNDSMEIENSQMVTNQQQEIKIYDLTRRRLNFTINVGIFYSCHCIAFDTINNLLLASISGQINFYDRNNGNLKFTVYFYPNQWITQIQLINKNQNLLGHNEHSLKLWNINYQYKRFDLIKKFNQDVYFFKSVHQDQRIIIRNENNLTVIDNNLNITYENKIKNDNFFIELHDEVETMNYILLVDKRGALVIWKSINKL